MVTTYDQDVDTDEDDEAPESELKLIFTAEGQAQLEEDGEPVWFSDADDDFQEQFGNEFLDADEDATDVLNFLEEEGFLESEEKAEVVIETEVDADGDLESDETHELNNNQD